MVLGCSQLHQPVLAVPCIQSECLPHKDGGGHCSEADTEPLVDANHIHDDKEDEQQQQTACKDEEVLSLQSLELNRTTDTLVYRVICHSTLF